MSEDFWVGILAGLLLAYVGWFAYAAVSLFREVVALASATPDSETNPADPEPRTEEET